MVNTSKCGEGISPNKIGIPIFTGDHQNDAGVCVREDYRIQARLSQFGGYVFGVDLTSEISCRGFETI